jgi:4-amino-4-deoxy-L-arabinose transferase-like glycosyltransferase
MRIISPADAAHSRLRRIYLGPLTQHWGMVFAVGLILIWFVVAMMTQSALMGDNIEQSNWAHSFEWGYYKHPPMPTMILIAAQQLLGPSWWMTNLLAALCLLGTAAATYALARSLTTARTAQFAVILWGLHLTMTWRVSLYNHNTVLMLFCSLVAWAVVRATQTRSMRFWLFAGICAGFALVSKYQAGVFFLVIFATLVRGKYLRDALHRHGLFWASVIAALIFSPHAIWLIANDFLPLHYASTQLPKSWSLDGQRATLSFSLQQLRFFWPSWVAILLCTVFIPNSNRHENRQQTTQNKNVKTDRMWVDFLSWGTLVVVICIGLTGTQLQNHWGLQTLQFACLGLAVQLDKRSSVKPWQFLAVAGVLHLLLIAMVVQTMVRNLQDGWQGKEDISFPARELTQQTLTDWERATSCPLKYVVGPSFESGTVAIFSGQNPTVLEGGSFVASPWIRKSDLETQGYLHLANTPNELPASSTARGSMVLTTAPNSNRPAKVYWAIVLPAKPC